MEEGKKELLKLLMEMRETASENLYKWVFAIITLCSVVSGYIVTKVLESAQSYEKIFASIGLIIFGGIILFSFGHLLKKFRNDYLSAWGTHKSVRGMNMTDEEKGARKTERDKPYQSLEGIYWSFCIGIVFTLLSILPLRPCFLSSKDSGTESGEKSAISGKFSEIISNESANLFSTTSPIIDVK